MSIQGKTITKADLVENVNRKVGFSKKESLDLVERVLDTIKNTLESGEQVKISGFGKFEVRQKRPRRGRNPKTGEEIRIPALRVLRFRPSQVLRSALLDGTLGEEQPIDLGEATFGGK